MALSRRCRCPLIEQEHSSRLDEAAHQRERSSTSAFSAFRPPMRPKSVTNHAAHAEGTAVPHLSLSRRRVLARL